MCVWVCVCGQARAQINFGEGNLEQAWASFMEHRMADEAARRETNPIGSSELRREGPHGECVRPEEAWGGFGEAPLQVELLNIYWAVSPFIMEISNHSLRQTLALTGCYILQQ